MEIFLNEIYRDKDGFTYKPIEKMFSNSGAPHIIYINHKNEYRVMREDEWIKKLDCATVNFNKLLDEYYRDNR